MRGSPPLHLLFFCLAFGLLAWPLSKLTFGRRVVSPPSSIAVVPTTDLTKTSTLIRLRFSHLPQSLTLRPLVPADAPVLLKLDATATSPTETSVDLTLDHHSIELALDATWPENTPDAAITIELEPDALDAQSRTVWSSDQQLSEVLTFQWKP